MRQSILPCNGLDKSVGVVARELALKLADCSGNEIICPVLLNNSPARYQKALVESSLLVIDGCPTRCATKLANKLGLKIDRKVLVSEEAKNSGLTPGDSMRLDPAGLQLAEAIATALSVKVVELPVAEQLVDFEQPTDFLSVTHDKYIFKIPADGYYFNENDCWVRVIGNRARVGVSDYVQQNMTDITYFEPAQVGAEIEQFDELGSLESSKAMLDALSPVSGKIIAVNMALVDNPGIINEDPYGKGWIAELEIRDFELDREFLLNVEAYSLIVKKKAEASEH